MPKGSQVNIPQLLFLSVWMLVGRFWTDRAREDQNDREAGWTLGPQIFRCPNLDFSLPADIFPHIIG